MILVEPNQANPPLRLPQTKCCHREQYGNHHARPRSCKRCQCSYHQRYHTQRNRSELSPHWLAHAAAHRYIELEVRFVRQLAGA
jgi:hypothetical protein